MELFDLEQLAAFSDCGTLSAAAEKLHLSQPTLTKTMKRLEEEFRVPLFVRSKNKLELNENGKLAAARAHKLLQEASELVNTVRAFDRSMHTISIGACAPMPLLGITQNIARLCKGMATSSEIQDIDILLAGLRENVYQVIILPYKPQEHDLYIKEAETESLFFALPENHRFADKKGLYMEEMDGENMLLLSNIGFWHKVHTTKMPHSRFLVQTERFDFDELIQSSILPCFVSDITLRLTGKPKNRVIVPILDKEAVVTYYSVCLLQNKEQLKCIM